MYVCGASVGNMGRKKKCRSLASADSMALTTRAGSLHNLARQVSGLLRIFSLSEFCLLLPLMLPRGYGYGRDWRCDLYRALVPLTAEQSNPVLGYRLQLQIGQPCLCYC